MLISDMRHVSLPAAISVIGRSTCTTLLLFTQLSANKYVCLYMYYSLLGAALRHEQVWLPDAPRSQTETLAAEIARELFRIHAHFYNESLESKLACRKTLDCKTVEAAVRRLPARSGND